MHKDTATSAHTQYTGGRTVKLRVMATPEDIRRAKQLLLSLAADNRVKVLSMSDMYANKGTSQYQRAYADIVIMEGGELDEL